MLNDKKLIKKLLPIAILLALAVILLGAYTRLTNAGLGCPDWPGCYGKILVPENIGDNNYGATWEFNSTKAWTEMAHRYLAGSLGVLIVTICSLVFYSTSKQFDAAFSSNRSIQNKKILATLLLGTLIFQAALGMWTVTLKLLPTVVMGHLIGGLATLSLLVLLLLNHYNYDSSVNFNYASKIICFLTGLMVFCQIILGGWTSSNYAAIPCLDFPTCNGQYLPTSGTLSAMNPFIAIGPNYEGGLLSNAMRVTIQLFHRWGALVTTALLMLTIRNIRKYKNNYYNNFSRFILFLITCQVTLGIINVKWALPLSVAVMHNGVAALLLITMVTLNFKINHQSKI